MTPARPTPDVDGLAELLAAHQIVYGNPDYWRCSCGFVSERTDGRASINEHRAEQIAAHLAAVTAERDEARAAVERVREMARRWKEAAGQDRDPESRTLRAVSAYLTAALDHVPTTEGGEG